MDRRTFIRNTGIVASAFSVSGFTFLDNKGNLRGNCHTTSDALGPKFREGAPFRTNLKYEGSKGTPLKVEGYVYGSDCKTPLRNIIIDIWHCDHRGNYRMKSKDYRCRGKLKTNEIGYYSFETIIPKHYNWRPKHIHYLIRNVENHKDLITQLYFAGDKRINQKTEHNHYPYDENRILETKIASDGSANVQLDLFLSPIE